MGEKDIKRQSPNVFRMKLLGAEIKSVSSGSKSLKDAMNEALRDWVTNVDNTFYIIGTVAGPNVANIFVLLGKSYSEALCCNISTAGNILPSKNSKKAPPPVDI